LNGESKLVSFFTPFGPYFPFHIDRRLVDKVLPEIGIIFSEESQFVSTAEILQGQDAEVFPGFGFTFPFGGNDTGDIDFFAFKSFEAAVEFFYRRAKQLHFQLIRIEGMGGQVNTDQLFFLFRFLIVVPGFAVGDIRFGDFEAVQFAE